MTHFAILCPPGAGHLNPMVALGYELRARGHRVTAINVPDARLVVEAAGIEFCSIGELDYPVGSIGLSLRELGRLQGFSAFRYTIEQFKRAQSLLFPQALVAIKAASVDFLLIDQTMPEGGTIAEILKLPFITVCNALLLNQAFQVPPIFFPWDYEIPSFWWELRNQFGYGLINLLTLEIRVAIARHRQTWFLPPYSSIDQVYSPWLQLSQQPLEFEFPRQDLPKVFHFTGPYSNSSSRFSVPFPYERLTGQPLIYASLGTIQNRRGEIFECIAAACIGLDVQVVISLGGAGGGEDVGLQLPGNPIVVEYAPQLELLHRAALVITHAGLNTTLEALSYAVPMVAIPITNDQPGVAARIAWTGTGKVVQLSELSVDNLRHAIIQVLTQVSYKSNATRLQTAIERSGGVRRAVDLTEQVVRTL